jgi:hypothetical protein
VTGAVIDVQPQNHETVTCEFHVGSVRYEAKELGHRFAGWDGGYVLYLPRDPSISSLTGPAEILQEYTGGILAGAIAFLLLRRLACTACFET